MNLKVKINNILIFFSNSLLYIYCSTVICFFTLISLYNHPVSDDVLNYSRVIQKGFWGAQQYLYLNWSGRYIHVFLASLQGLSSNFFFSTKLIPILLIFLFLVAVYFFVKLILVNCTSLIKIQITMIFSVVYLLGLPEINSSFYWVASALSYQVGILLFMFFAGLILVSVSSGGGVTIYKILSFILLFLLIGINEIMLIYVMVFLFLVIVYVAINYRKFSPFLIYLIIFGVICSIISIFAPGNEARFIAETDGVYVTDSSLRHNFIHSIIESISLIFRLLFSYRFLFLLLITAELAIILRGRKTYSNTIFNKLFISFSSIILLFVSIFPSFWATNDIQPRVMNVIWFILLLSCVINIYIYIDLLYKLNLVSYLKKPIVLFFVMCIGILILGYSINYRTIACDLLKGRAIEYDRQLNARYQLINNCKTDICYIPKLNIFAYSIFRDDISDCYQHNRWLAMLFNKEKILPIKDSNEDILLLEQPSTSSYEINSTFLTNK